MGGARAKTSKTSPLTARPTLARLQYNKSKQTASLIRQMVKKTGLSHLELNKQITWPLSKKFKHPIEAFKLCLDNADEVFQSVECSAEVWAQLVAIIKKRMTPTAVKIRWVF